MGELAYMQIKNPVLKSQPVISGSLIHSIFLHFTPNSSLSYFTKLRIASIDCRGRAMYVTIREKS